MSKEFELIEVNLPGTNEEEVEVSFKRVIETLKRIGVPSQQERTLNQSVHILKRKKKVGEELVQAYYLLHFKQLFGLDGNPCNMSDEDVRRLNRVVYLLDTDWEMVKVANDEVYNDLQDNMIPMQHVKIIKHDDVWRDAGEVPEGKWKLRQKYPIGRRKNKRQYENTTTA